MWIAQALSGLLLLLLLGSHMVANHYVAEGGLRDYDAVVAYLSHPLIRAWEVLFLVVVTAHALLGLRSILLDLGPSPAQRRWIDRGLWLLGVGTVLYGVWLTWTLTGGAG